MNGDFASHTNVPTLAVYRMLEFRVTLIRKVEIYMKFSIAEILLSQLVSVAGIIRERIGPQAYQVFLVLRGRQEMVEVWPPAKK